MTYQEEGQIRLRLQHSKHAVALAMQGRWREAVVANKEIIDNYPNDVNAYNRLGRAYMELGEYSEASGAYSKSLELDPYNVIAKKNLHRLSRLGEKVVSSVSDSIRVDPQHFIEDTGRAGVINLYQLAPAEVLSRMVAGDSVFLKIDGTKLVVESGRGECLGQVEPRHGQRLIKLMEGGNKYTAAIISSAEDMVTVIIREVYQDPSQAGRLSFPLEPRPYIADRILRRELGEEDEEEEELDYSIISVEETKVIPKDGDSTGINDKGNSEV